MMVVLTVTVALAAAGGAQAAFSGVGALGTGRYNHTATLLEDGHLLVAGGTNNGPLDSARLYDPAQNTWSNAASMTIPREGAAAVLLHSGKVLVAGGQTSATGRGAPSYTPTAEIYDPANDTWASAGSMSTGRFQPTMTVLEDGRVLVAGGSGDVDTGGGVNAAVSLDSAEIYDPATGAWSDAAAMSVPRAMHTATLLPDGNVLVAGGYDEARTSSRAPRSTTRRAILVGDGLARRTPVTPPPPRRCRIDDGPRRRRRRRRRRARSPAPRSTTPGTGTWHDAATMAGARQTAAAALLKDGTVLVTGGKDARQGSALATTERYDPGPNTWSDAGAMTAARKGHTLTALDDGRALVVGGNAGGLHLGPRLGRALQPGQHDRHRPGVRQP